MYDLEIANAGKLSWFTFGVISDITERNRTFPLKSPYHSLRCITTRAVDYLLKTKGGGPYKDVSEWQTGNMFRKDRSISRGFRCIGLK